jgi:hypothetical protein
MMDGFFDGKMEPNSSRLGFTAFIVSLSKLPNRLHT